jgi:hypothetical protein
MRKDDAHWMADGDHFTLHVDGELRAAANVVFNYAVLYGPRRLFRKTEETFLVDMSVVVVAEVERRLGLREVPILGHDGVPQTDARRRMEENARNFENANHQPSPDPLGETAWMMRKAHDALNAAAVAADLCDLSGEARDWCARATRIIKEEGRICADATAAIKEAERTLSKAIEEQPVLNIRLIEAVIHLQRAAGLADVYGEGRSVPQESIQVMHSEGSDLAERAWRGRTSKAFGRGI